jgi:hypothetical protein
VRSVALLHLLPLRQSFAPDLGADSGSAEEPQSSRMPPFGSGYGSDCSSPKTEMDLMGLRFVADSKGNCTAPHYVWYTSLGLFYQNCASDKLLHSTPSSPS